MWGLFHADPFEVPAEPTNTVDEEAVPADAFVNTAEFDFQILSEHADPPSLAATVVSYGLKDDPATKSLTLPVDATLPLSTSVGVRTN